MGLKLLALVATTVLGVSLWASGTAAGATSDGATYPCTDDFAKEVAISSGFADAAAKANPNYGDPKFWLAMQTVCADFDGDGNEEMVFSLGAMGGTDPWAFFDIPNGRASEATYSFPTIDKRGAYPNHRLETVRVEGKPAIRDVRRLFRPRDAHCCPTGGRLIRVVGFLVDGYSVLESDVVRPPGLHKVRLTVGLAKNAAAQFLDRKYSEAWTNRAGGRLKCNKHLAFNVRKCEVGFVIGDQAYFGPLRIALFERGLGDQHATIRYRVTRFNEYCALVLHGPRKQCVKVDRGTARLHF